jgi:hypothetical protein
MALFKVFKGHETQKITDPSAVGYRAPAEGTNGFAYYDTSSNLFYIDAEYPNSEGIVTPNDVSRDSLAVLSNHIRPIVSKTFTNLIGSSNDATGASFYFGKIRPTSWNVVWRIKYKIHTYVPGQASYE